MKRRGSDQMPLPIDVARWRENPWAIGGSVGATSDVNPSERRLMAGKLRPRSLTEGQRSEAERLFRTAVALQGAFWDSLFDLERALGVSESMRVETFPTGMSTFFARVLKMTADGFPGLIEAREQVIEGPETRDSRQFVRTSSRAASISSKRFSSAPISFSAKSWQSE